MSASLVGSEMCIRDSLKHTNTDLGVRSWNCAGPETTSHFHRSRPRLRSCLLYTSDAADDM
eukprot:13589043-Alexandrium_andersonii.AAC.1